jgi:predicted nucleotidyltransferase
MGTLETIEAYCSIAGNGVTVIAAACALIYKDKIKAMTKLLAHAFLHERNDRIKFRLNRLESLNYNNAKHKDEIMATLGQLAGSIKNLAKNDDDYASCYEQIIDVTDRKGEMDEVTKGQIVQELYDLISRKTEAATTILLK